MYYRQPLPQSPPTLNASSFRQNAPTVMKVTGEGVLSASADRALITLGVITENKNLSKGQSENATIMSNVIKSLVAIGISKDDIETVVYRIDSEYDYENGQQVFRGYKVTHQILVTVDEIMMTGHVVDTAVNNGANSVSSIQFTVRDRNLYYNQALSKAIENGQHKAATIARELGVTLYQVPNKIEEVSQATIPIPYTATLLATSEATPIQPGEVQITAAVKIEYSYTQ